MSTKLRGVLHTLANTISIRIRVYQSRRFNDHQRNKSIETANYSLYGYTSPANHSISDPVLSGSRSGAILVWKSVLLRGKGHVTGYWPIRKQEGGNWPIRRQERGKCCRGRWKCINYLLHCIALGSPRRLFLSQHSSLRIQMGLGGINFRILGHCGSEDHVRCNRP